jgi:hypothetical protein
MIFGLLLLFFRNYNIHNLRSLDCTIFSQSSPTQLPAFRSCTVRSRLKQLVENQLFDGMRYQKLTAKNNTSTAELHTIGLEMPLVNPTPRMVRKARLLSMTA